jgi:hypothetical protein
MFCPECEETYPSTHTVCPTCRTDLEPPATVTARHIRNGLGFLAAGVAVAVPVFDLSIAWAILVPVFGTMALVIQLLYNIDD